jgi:hypothetical protein
MAFRFELAIYSADCWRKSYNNFPVQ